MEFSLCLLWRDRWGPNSVNFLQSKQPPLLFSTSQILPCCGPYASNGGGTALKEGASALAAAALVSASVHVLSGVVGYISFLAHSPSLSKRCIQKLPLLWLERGQDLKFLRRLERCLDASSVPEMLATALLPVVVSAVSISAVKSSAVDLCASSPFSQKPASACWVSFRIR